jgi:thiopeptide-type bacteriocin biosynthesis protein
MFLNQLIVRTPSLPFNDDISEEFLKQILTDATFVEALYLGSPVLFQEAINWKDGKITDAKKLQKIPISLGKYYLRMCSRSTPFGLFAGCGVVNWSEETLLEISEESSRKTRLDMHFAGALAQKLAEIYEIKFSLKFSPNSSVYRVGEEIRYIEYSYQDGQRKHKISAIDWSEYIHLVLDLCKFGKTINEIVPNLIADDISEEDAIGFIEQLIESQLLVSELEPAITGEEFTSQIKSILSNHNNISELLNNIERLLSKIDLKTNNDISVYQEVIEIIKNFGIPFEDGKLFQTDLIKKFNKKYLNCEYQNVLIEIYNLFKKIAINPENQKLKEFKKKYNERYETRELPILLALDTEVGIGYGEQGKSKNTPIAEGLTFPENTNNTLNYSQNLFQQFLFTIWLNAYKNDDFQVELKEEDLKKFAINDVKVPPSNSIMFRLTGDEKLPIYLEGISGSSGANLLGRFAHANYEILDIIQKLTEQEQVKNPNVIFAEIVHLPENRIGNILLHPPFRAYEIPYLAKSSLPIENQISLDDLYVSIDILKDKVILRSKRFNKEVIPRLSNAHNFSQNSLPLYNFLCDLQTQNLQNNFDLGWFNIAPQTIFSPRLIYKNVIVSLATWRFKKKDFISLTICKTENLLSTVHNFCARWKLPKRFVLADYDNELLVNTDNLLSTQIWIDAIKNRDKIELREFVYEHDNCIVKNNLGQGFTNQFIASFINDETVHHGLNEKNNDENAQIQRNFSVGSEWLYFKFYVGTKMTDSVLTQVLKPLVEKLFHENLIDKWFFIRYADPEKHIRFRVHFTDLSIIGSVFLEINNALQPFENEGIIWKTQVDSYQREIERYGWDVMELTESIFYADSIAIIGMIDQTWGEEREVIRWQWCLKLIDAYLTDFELSMTEKINLLERMKKNFANQFNINKDLKLQLDQRFRTNRNSIELILDNSLNKTHDYSPLFELINTKSEQIKALIPQIKSLKSENELMKYLSDTIHMTVNRTIGDNQRTHELVMYDFLFRYYQAELARKSKPPQN